MPTTQRHLWQYQWFRDALLLLGLLLALWFIYVIQAIVVPVLIGFALAYAVNPLVTWSKRRLRIPRLASGLILLALGLTVLGLLLFFFLPSLISQARSLTASLGNYFAWVADQTSRYWDAFINRTLAAVAPQPAATAPTQPTASTLPAVAEPPAPNDVSLAALGNLVFQSLGIGVGVVGTAIGTGSYLLLALAIVLFCFIVFVWHFQAILDWFAQFIPAASRPQTIHIVTRFDRALSGFIRGRLVQAAIITVNLAIGWRLAGVPFWLLLAAICGVLNLIPYMAVLGWLIAVALTLVDRLSAGSVTAAGFPWSAIVWPTVAYALAQLVDGWIVEPLVQGKATDLNSLTVLLAVVTGGVVAGLLGMLLAIPVTACLKILAEELLLPRLRAYAKSSGPPPAG